MTANAVVRARVNENVKKEAAIVLAAIGLTVSDAFRLLLTRIVEERALPFRLLTPTRQTIAAVRVARGDFIEAERMDYSPDNLIEND